MAPRHVPLLVLTALLASACSPASPAASPGASARPAEASRPAALPSPTAGLSVAPAGALARQAAPAPTADRAGGAPPKDAAAESRSAPAAASASTAPAAQPLPAVQPTNRMVVYTADLTLLVKDVQSAIGRIGDLAALQGGYVAGVENADEGSVPVSTVRIKVLPDRYQTAMSALRALAIEVQNEKAATQDVTEEYDDVQTQLASLEATHRQLLELMSRAGTVDEVLKIQQQATQVKLQIDRLRGRATVLERLSDLATITARLQPAEAALARDYVVVRGQLRQAQAAQAAQLRALKRARTPEEQAAIRDKLGELSLQVDRASARLQEIEQKAAQNGLALPAAPPDDPTVAAASDDELAEQYLEARVQLRRTEAAQASLTRQLQGSLSPDEQAALRKQLGEMIVELTRLNGRLKSIQERAGQLGVVLPTLTSEQEAALAGTAPATNQPDPLRAAGAAWEASLAFLRGALAGLLGAVVFLWWALPLAAAVAVAVRRGWLRRRATSRAAERPTG